MLIDFALPYNAMLGKAFHLVFVWLSALKVMDEGPKVAKSFHISDG
jgi:hypothetical protein